jgi:hypothetical protein
MTRIALLTLSGFGVRKTPPLSESPIGKTGYEFP